MLTQIRILKEKKATTTTSKFPVRMPREIVVPLTKIVKADQGRELQDMIDLVGTESLR